MDGCVCVCARYSVPYCLPTIIIIEGYIKDAPSEEYCAQCEGKILTGELVISATKFMENIVWHPNCFACTTCHELLVDLTYCVFEDRIYCERHYAELMKPRCSGCDEVSDE